MTLSRNGETFGPGRRSREHGFALVAVIWGLGLIVLLGATVVVDAKYRGRIASVDTSITRASAAAESAVNLAIAAILTPEEKINFPLLCRMPGGEQAFITVEEEIGKVDLNTGSKTTLERLFAALASDKAVGQKIAAEILVARSLNPNVAGEAGSQPVPETSGTRAPPRLRFTSSLELDQMTGMTPELFRKTLPFVTVGSGRTEPSREAASPALMRILGLDPPPVQSRRPLGSGNVTVRADVSLLDGSRQVREALVAFGSQSGQPYAIREWRLGYAAEPSRQQRRVTPCLKV